MADSRTINGLSLCAGYGGLDLGLHLAFGDRYRTVAMVEREAYATGILAARMADGTMDAAPVWSDLATFDGRRWRGVVDLVSGGFPCQPWSCAGQRRGTDDARWIWPEVARVVSEVGPGLVFLENVPGLLAGDGLGLVLGDLAALGFDAEWCVLGADDYGAPHRRKRVWILAYRGSDRLQGGESTAGTASCVRRRSAESGGGMADAIGLRLSQRGSKSRDDGTECPATERGGGSLADARDGQLSEQGRGSEGRAGVGSDGADLPVWPPGPDDADAWARILAVRPDLAPAVANTTQRAGDTQQGERQDLRDVVGIRGGPRAGRSGEETEPGLRGMADGALSRVDQLRACGNGVVPVVAAAAFLSLAGRAWLRP